ncbi:hypothetical protein D3OALGA1CA_2868 [Olavius algarvensis associated proteobacterium Delta 3]|nr:hypothetical protein D3OALGA1CA_2868 [Olavius algarvensis associated proteobacterium Delta 3]CAB5163064.1 hypothetical protein D3OALGB2SA_5556 [Olavius algarvensis associated proteobacterium Delta 3]
MLIKMALLDQGSNGHCAGSAIEAASGSAANTSMDTTPVNPLVRSKAMIRIPFPREEKEKN